MLAWISIDNSDDRLGPVLWAEFIKDVDEAIDSHAWNYRARMVHTLPTSQYQNCHWCVELGAHENQGLISDLTKLAKQYKQDAISYNEVQDTIFIMGVQ